MLRSTCSPLPDKTVDRMIAYRNPPRARLPFLSFLFSAFEAPLDTGSSILIIRSSRHYTGNSIVKVKLFEIFSPRNREREREGSLITSEGFGTEGLWNGKGLCALFARLFPTTRVSG